MNRSRLLLALPAATALVLAGGSPALAGGDGHSDNDTWAKVIEINDEAFSRLYGHTSHPFSVKKGQKIAVRVISQFGEETTKVIEVDA